MTALKKFFRDKVVSSLGVVKERSAACPAITIKSEPVAEEVDFTDQWK